MENTGSSSTSNQFQNKATVNFHRLCQLFVTICSELFRDIVLSCIDDLRLKLDECKDKLVNGKNCNLFPSQKEILYPKSDEKETDLEDMDLSLLYILLRHICDITAPKKGWGKEHEESDFSIGACIDNIRIKRNVLFAHAHTGSIDTDSFNHEWGYLKNNIVKIAEKCNFVERYKEKVDELHTCTLDPSVTIACLEIIKKMEEEMNIKLKIKEEAIQNLQEDSLLLHHFHAVKRDDMEKISTSIRELQERVDRLEEASGGKRKCPGRSAEKQPKDIFTEDSSISTTSAKLISTIDVGSLSRIYHIAYINPGLLWVSDSKTLLLINLSGNIIKAVNDALCWFGSFAVRKDGVLFYIDKNQRCIKENNTGRVIDLLKTRDERLRCIHVSKRNKDLLVVIKDTEKRKCRVIRYNIERQSEEILIDGEQRLIEYPSYITENSNGDVVVSDHSKKKVVVVNSLGQHRFNIKKLRIGSEFSPDGTCTDDNGRIFVLDTNPPKYIYIFDQEGNLTQQLDTKNDSGSGLCVDDQGHMYVGNHDGTIDVYNTL